MDEQELWQVADNIYYLVHGGYSELAKKRVVQAAAQITGLSAEHADTAIRIWENILAPVTGEPKGLVALRRYAELAVLAHSPEESNDG